jgi:hypothetical protein
LPVTVVTNLSPGAACVCSSGIKIPNVEDPAGVRLPQRTNFPMTRPLWTPTNAQRRQAETMAAYGIPEADIARVLGVSKPTLRKHCGTELDTGATKA